MNRGIYALPVITILGLLAGCVSGPPLQTTIIVSPSKPLEIYGVRTYRTNKGVLVMGRVRRPMLFRGPVWGHLHVEGLFDDRRAPIVADTRWGTLSPRGSRSASFSAELPTTDPLEIKSVRIEYRAERDRARSPHLD